MMQSANPCYAPQLDAHGQLRHLLTIDGLTPQHLTDLLDKAETFFDPNTQQIKQNNALQQMTVANLFFEPSTRTRSTFELAAKKLSAHVLNLPIAHSATKKGESLRDTVRNLKAMQCQILVVRHGSSGAAQFIASQVDASCTVINAGDGWHAHPTQALLDMYTIRKHRGDFKNLTVAIVGDVLHSRVARSQIHALHLLRAGEIRVISPKSLLPPHLNQMGVNVFHDLETGLNNVDVIMMLRLQSERMETGLLPPGNAYYRSYGLTPQSLHHAKNDALIIHPGPINRGVEIHSDIADSPNAVILDQVTNGIAVRMAVMSTLVNNLQKRQAL